MHIVQFILFKTELETLNFIFVLTFCNINHLIYLRYVITHPSYF